jgi:ABC-type Zn uptake system ZnuABC Zn-binding protein ZnuA
VDKTGLSMSWKTGVSIISFIICLILGWATFVATLAKKSDVESHNVSVYAHPVVLEKGEDPIPIAVIAKRHETEFKTITQVKKTVDSNKTEVLAVKNSFNEDRAERLADRAADKVKDSAKSRERWKQVKEKAKQNLSENKPIRDGLENYL